MTVEQMTNREQRQTNKRSEERWHSLRYCEGSRPRMLCHGENCVSDSDGGSDCGSDDDGGYGGSDGGGSSGVGTKWW